MKIVPLIINEAECKDSIDLFLKLFETGVESFYRMGELTRAELAKDPEWAEKVCERSRLLTVQFVHRAANIGLKYIPEFAINEKPGPRRMRNLPLELQKRHLTEPVDVLTQSDRGEWEPLRVDVFSLSQDQAVQVIAEDHLRTDSEQRAWIEDRRARAQIIPEVVTDLPWKFYRGKIIVTNGGWEFGAKELKMFEKLLTKK